MAVAQGILGLHELLIGELLLVLIINHAGRNESVSLMIPGLVNELFVLFDMICHLFLPLRVLRLSSCVFLLVTLGCCRHLSGKLRLRELAIRLTVSIFTLHVLMVA